jgi:hypothetical protein
MPLQHPLGLNVLGIRILVRCSDNYGVTALSGNCSYSMSTIGKEGIVEIWNDESNGPASLTSEGTRQLIRAIS